MVEKAFRAKPGSRFEKMYFRSEKFLDDFGHKLLRFTERMVGYDGEALITDRLIVKLTEEGRREYASQILKKREATGTPRSNCNLLWRRSLRKRSWRVQTGLRITGANHGSATVSFRVLGS